MPALRPVSAEARLTLVEHLTELRSRLIISLAIFAVAFAFTYWQNKNVLKIVNQPLENAAKVKKNCAKSGDPLETGACFDRAIAKAIGELAPVVNSVAAQSDNPVEARQARQASQSLIAAQRLAPKSTSRQPVTLGVAEPFFQTINVAMYAALVITLPLILYQLYAFLIPAFTRRERKAIVPLLIGVPFLFYAGVAFGYFLALPRAVDFLQNFNDQSFDILVQAKDYYKFVALFLAGTGVVFQVPVVVLGISRMGLFSARQMRKKRGMVVLASAVVAAIITPTPDAVTMLLMMLPLVVLFEGSVLVASVLEGRRERRPSRWDSEDDDEPQPQPPSDDDAYGDGGDDGPDGGGDHGGPGAGHPDDGGADEPPHEDWADPWDEQDGDPPSDTALAPPGEEPDPALLGDPAGPRVLDGDPDPDPLPPVGGTAEAPPSQEDEWLAQADALDAADPYAADSPSGRDIHGSNAGREDER